MAYFRKKPIVIEAMRVVDLLRYAKEDWQSLPDWILMPYDTGKVLFLADSIEISTLEGNVIGSPLDWIICGVQGELYPCKPDIFEATYESAEEGIAI